jgi:hypothetical protein
VKFPSELRILEQPSIVLFRDGSQGQNFSLYLEAEDPATGANVLLRVVGATAEPQGGDAGQELLRRIERERENVQAAFDAKR